MNVKDNKGFSLVELLVAIAIMAAFVIPTCSAFVLTARMNNKTDEMMQAQLAVSSTVETLMAKGITDEYLESLTVVEAEDGSVDYYTSTEFPGLRFELAQTDGNPYFAVNVTDEEGQVEVETHIRDNATKTLEEVGVTK